MTTKYWMTYSGDGFSLLYRTNLGLPGAKCLGRFNENHYDNYCGIKALSEEEATLYLLSLDIKPNA